MPEYSMSDSSLFYSMYVWLFAWFYVLRMSYCLSDSMSDAMSDSYSEYCMSDSMSDSIYVWVFYVWCYVWFYVWFFVWFYFWFYVRILSNSKILILFLILNLVKLEEEEQVDDSDDELSILGDSIVRNIQTNKLKLCSYRWSARRCPWNQKNKILFFSLCYPRDTHGFPQKMSANLVQPLGHRLNSFLI